MDPSCRLVAVWTEGRQGDSTTFTAMNATLKQLVDAVPDPQCDDGIDNDGNGRIDFPSDPHCLSLGGRELRGCGLGSEVALLIPLLRFCARRRGAAKLLRG